MVDRSDVEASIGLVGVASVTYYPDKSVDEPGYTIDEDLRWCMKPLGALPQEVADELRRAIAAAIIDPTHERESAIRRLRGLVPD